MAYSEARATMQDILYHLVDHLAPVDKLSLALAYPEYTKKVNASLDEYIKLRIRSIPGYGDQLLSALKPHGMVIAGGYLLQCIIGNDELTHTSSDIDVYCVGIDSTIDELLGESATYDTAPQHLKHIFVPYELGFHTNSVSMLDVYRGLPMSSKIFVHPKCPRYMNMIFIDTSRKRLYPCDDNRKESKTVQEFVDTYFDFDFCKLTFDGEHLVVSHPEAIVYRRSMFKVKLEKYLCAACLYTPDLPPHPERLALEQLLNRVAKYRKRGFRIDLDESITWKRHSSDCPYNRPFNLYRYQHLRNRLETECEFHPDVMELVNQFHSRI
jgi:hypothetical protein